MDSRALPLQGKADYLSQALLPSRTDQTPPQLDSRAAPDDGSFRIVWFSLKKPIVDHWIHSMLDLEKHLERPHPSNDQLVYIIAEDHLPDEAVWLLGSRLGLDASFWALLKYKGEEVPEMTRPSNIAKRKSYGVKLPATNGNVGTQTISVGLCRKSSSVAFLVPKYDLTGIRDWLYSGFVLDHTGTTESPRSAMQALLSGTMAVAAEPDCPFLQVCCIPIRLAVCEWTSTVHKMTGRGVASHKDHANSRGALLAAIDGLYQALEHTYSIFRLGRYPEQDHRDAKQSQRDAEQGLRDMLITDLRHLNRWAKRFLGGCDAVCPDNPKPCPPRSGHHSEIFEDYAATIRDTANKMQDKLDLIAYVTSLLFSLTFIATVYGMNLDIYTDGGLVSLKTYLATALPFTAGIFFLTFYFEGIKAHFE